jgi:hypothetical protein
MNPFPHLGIEQYSGYLYIYIFYYYSCPPFISMDHWEYKVIYFMGNINFFSEISVSNYISDSVVELPSSMYTESSFLLLVSISMSKS